MKNKFLRFIWFSFSSLIGCGLIGIVVIAYFTFTLPKISSLADYRPAIPSQILSKDGTVLAEIGREEREVVPFNEIPQLIVDAFVSAEDSGFYEHKGVDYAGVLRALYVNILAGRVVQGGSTITQQVAKSLLLSRERSITRKIKDFLLAQRIEKKFSKEEILFLYLNQVYLGGGYYGIKSAFKGYFGKDLKEATIAEIAIVAGLLVAPGRYSPYINPQAAKSRQHYVLGRMLTNGKISQPQYDEAIKEKIKFRLRKRENFKAGYFTDWVRQRVIELVGEDKFLEDGFKIQTTLDWDLQKIAEKEVWQGVKEIDKRQGFKGPVSKLSGNEELLGHNKKFREEFYKENSQFFTLADDYERKYELVFDEENYLKVREVYEKWDEEVKSSKYRKGTTKIDPFLNYIKVGEVYKATVTSVDDKAQIIYVDIAGVPGIIPYKYFRWAHERNINEERQYFPYVKRPSTIVSAYDQILVEVKDKNASLEHNMDRDYVSSFKKSTFGKQAITQRFLLCSLEQEPEAQGALVSIDPKTGHILAFVGGSDFSKSQFNRAIQSLRQPGSSFKPVLYAAALENGFTPASIIMDSPEALGGADENLNWKPRNYDGKFKGPMTFRNSLELSRNIPTIKIANKIGIPTILDFVERLGIKAKIDQDLSSALGSFGITLLDLVTTYAIFPNGGKKVHPKSILSIIDRDGNPYELNEAQGSGESLEKNEIVTEAEKPDEKAEGDKEAEEMVSDEKEEKDMNPFYVTLGGDQVYDPRLAYLMTNLLRGVVQHGTGRQTSHISKFIGGKTGTTNNYVDAWFMGFSSNLVTGVWTGFDDNKTLGWAETGSKSALPIWREFMKEGIQRYGEYDFQVPLGIVNIRIDKETGRLARPGDSSAFLEAFVEGTEPGQVEKEPAGEADIKSTGPLFEEEEYYDSQ